MRWMYEALMDQLRVRDKDNIDQKSVRETDR